MLDYELLEALEDEDLKLTAWEQDFVESVTQQDYSLTDKQRTIAERILDQ